MILEKSAGLDSPLKHAALFGNRGMSTSGYSRDCAELHLEIKSVDESDSNGLLRIRTSSPAFGKREESEKSSRSYDGPGDLVLGHGLSTPEKKVTSFPSSASSTARQRYRSPSPNPLLDNFPRDEAFALCGKEKAPDPISFLSIILSSVLGTLLLTILVIQAFFRSLPYVFTKRKIRDPEQRISSVDSEGGADVIDQVSKDPRLYARSRGLDIAEEIVETGDGFELLLHHIIDPNTDGEKANPAAYPILVLHGLFQGSGSFITNGDKSLAFWLVKNGYDVWLGNLRTVHGMGHRTLSRDDPRFWDHNIYEYAKYDLPALVTHVCARTGYSKIAYIGHSQGTSIAFMALSRNMVPQLSNHLSSIAALAPAVYAGPLMSNYPFRQMRQMSANTWERVFGRREFEPIMSWAYAHVPSRPFAAAGYLMFSSYFQWTDKNWVRGQRTHHFRFMPTTVSAKNVYWWASDPNGFGARGCILDDTTDEPWYNKGFPPLALFMGGIDYLVDGSRLLERLETREPNVEVLLKHVEAENEHLDTFYGYRCVEETYKPLMAFIEQTRSNTR